MTTSPDPKTIAVDFDGTLCRDAYPGIGEPNYSLINTLIEARRQGHQIILYTLRGTDTKDGDTLTPALAWCNRQGLNFDAVNSNIPERIETWGSDPRKIAADIYIDDRAMHPNALNILLNILGLSIVDLAPHSETGFGAVKIESLTPAPLRPILELAQKIRETVVDHGYTGPSAQVAVHKDAFYHLMDLLAAIPLPERTQNNA
jgi:hypothetical protein